MFVLYEFEEPVSTLFYKFFSRKNPLQINDLQGAVLVYTGQMSLRLSFTLA